MSLPIITIARTFGSGGRTIGKKTATLLGIPIYDRELVEITAEKSGFHSAVIEHMQHSRPGSLLYTISGAAPEFQIQDQVFFAQADVIRDLAEKGPAVFVGRCADSILEKKHRVLKVFIHAPLEDRVKRAVEQYHLETRSPKDYIKKMDKKRRSYYDYYTHHNWGKSQNYDLCIDSSIGLDLAADLIARAARDFPE